MTSQDVVDKKSEIITVLERALTGNFMPKGKFPNSFTINMMLETLKSGDDERIRRESAGITDQFLYHLRLQSGVEISGGHVMHHPV